MAPLLRLALATALGSGPGAFAAAAGTAAAFGGGAAAECSRRASGGEGDAALCTVATASAAAPAILSQAPSLLQRRSEVQHQRFASAGAGAGAVEALGAGVASSSASASSSSLERVTGAAAEDCCANFDQWPNVDNGVTCDSCTALVKTWPYRGRCDKYCESFGHVCVSAAEEICESCKVKFMTRCDKRIWLTSDMLCRCRLPVDKCPHALAPALPWHRKTEKRIRVQGRQILVNGQPIHLKGVAWNPVGKGGRHPANLDFAGFVDRDIEVMVSAGINAVRTYSPITDINVLDKLWARGIWVLNSVYNWGGSPANAVIGPVNAVKHHPAILMWTIGNEWNYNGLYIGMDLWSSAARLQEAANIIKRHDTDHPVACIYGELHLLRDIDAHMPAVDVWGVNAYRGIGFGDLFDSYATLSSKPLFLGEYGADAYNAHAGREDQESQAKATKQLTKEIVAHSSMSGGVCFGGFVFELADEWWKDDEGNQWAHDVGGVAPGGGPYPDMTFNEEWWGLVEIDRKPRLALAALREVGMPTVTTV